MVERRRESSNVNQIQWKKVHLFCCGDDKDKNEIMMMMIKVFFSSGPSRKVFHDPAIFESQQDVR